MQIFERFFLQGSILYCDYLTALSPADSRLMAIKALKTIRIAYMPSENVLPRTRAFAFPFRKRTFEPGIYCTARRAKASKNLDEAADGKERVEVQPYKLLWLQGVSETGSTETSSACCWAALSWR